MSYCNTSSASFVCMSPDRPSDNAYHPYNSNALCIMHYVCIFSAPMSGSSKVHALRHICIVTICNMNISTVPHMGPIFRTTFHLGIYPDQWRHSSTIVLRKPGRPDYSLPKAYRPITLLDTMAKILLSCVADDLTYIAEQNNLLPSTHFGGRPGRSTTDSLHLLTKFVTDAWASKDNFVSVLFLDVKATFPSVIVNRLLHNLRKARIPKEYI